MNAPCQISVGPGQSLVSLISSLCLLVALPGKFGGTALHASPGPATTGGIPAAMASVRTYQQGTMLYLETVDDAGSSRRVGVDTHWGGTIVEVSLNGKNFVNANDPGRMIQTSLWDGNVDYNRNWSYNPYQAGDEAYDPSPVLAQAVGADTIYTKTWPLQWSPWASGGNGGPVESDAEIEQWVSAIPGHPNGFHVHMKVTHFGTDSHASCGQEYPVVYANRGIDTFVYYGGEQPWSGGALTHYTMPLNPARSPELYTPENWGAYVDADDFGLTVYMPGSYPWMYGFNAPGPSPGGTNHFVGTTPVSWDPGLVVESDFYVFTGSVTDARAVIYALHPQQPSTSPFPPFGYLDQPQPDSTVHGTITVEGWVLSLSPLTDIGVYVDGVRCGTGTAGTPRDISFAYPHTPPNVGFQFALATNRFANGVHTIVAKATDASGKVATFQTKRVTISNATPGDFNGDGHVDLPWQNTITGERCLWLMSGTAFLTDASLGVIPTQWSIAGVGDFNGDGQADLLWQNIATGERCLWLMNGPAFVSGLTLGVVPTDWSIAGVGDFNGDGQPDIIWQNAVTGERFVWLMNGPAFASGHSLGLVPTQWAIAAVADFNRDGWPDLVWQNGSTGERFLWMMNGTAFQSGIPLGAVPVQWSIAGAGDFDGDGQADLVWQNTVTGERFVWLMHDTHFNSGLSLGAIPVEWSIRK